MSPPEWLASFCEPAGSREIAKHSWSIEWQGQPHTFATDGIRMVVVRGDYGCPSPPNHKSVVAILDNERVVTPVPISLADLKRFCGVPEERVPCATCKDGGEIQCPECKGEGGEECECSCGDVHTADCSRCHGRRDVQCPDCMGELSRRRPALLGTRHFDRSLLARTLLALPGESATWEQCEGEYGAAIVTADEWTLVVMPLNSAERVDAPVYEPLRLAKAVVI